MMEPVPRQPESIYWYQVGCMIGCTCSGGGKETYPSLASVNCQSPATPTLTKASELTWNVLGTSPMGQWNKYMPWRAPGTSKPLDACGIASGFSPDAKVQFPHKFTDTSIAQGAKGTELKAGKVTVWAPNATVEASYRLVVNHGGGYQYRVCPKTESPTEACFQANPLAFANSKTTVVYNTGKRIMLNAVDVTTGVQPAGHAWRRLPVPACNCDLGSGCQNTTLQVSKKGDGVAYKTGIKPHGHCTLGLQFEAPHLTDGTWADGFGYYIAKLGTEGTKTDACVSYGDEATCDKNVKSGCAWYAGKGCHTGKGKSAAEVTKTDNCTAYGEQNACDKYAPSGCAWYEGKGCFTGNTNKSAAPETDACPQIKDQKGCDALLSKSGCVWYEAKKVCYKPGAKTDGAQKGASQGGFAGTGTKDASVHQWWVTDELKAPSKPGDYILQWRWDNEQTPQIWTTCADIRVGDTTASSAGIGLNVGGAVLGLHIFLVAGFSTLF